MLENIKAILEGTLGVLIFFAMIAFELAMLALAVYIGVVVLRFMGVL